MDKRTKTLLARYGFRLMSVGGDPLHDVYEDLGVRPTSQLIDDRKFLDEPKWIGNEKNPKFGTRFLNPNYGTAITAQAALQLLVDEGEIDRSWLAEVEAN
jgi:hypothetical protein